MALERLRAMIGRDFQLIGLSATIGSPEKVARFLVGKDRQVQIIRVPVARILRLKIIFPQPDEEDLRLASQLYTHPEVAARLRVIKDYISKHKSVLLFTNTQGRFGSLSEPAQGLGHEFSCFHTSWFSRQTFSFGCRKRLEKWRIERACVHELA